MRRAPGDRADEAGSGRGACACLAVELVQREGRRAAAEEVDEPERVNEGLREALAAATRDGRRLAQHDRHVAMAEPLGDGDVIGDGAVVAQLARVDEVLRAERAAAAAAVPVEVEGERGGDSRLRRGAGAGVSPRTRARATGAERRRTAPGTYAAKCAWSGTHATLFLAASVEPTQASSGPCSSGSAVERLRAAMRAWSAARSLASWPPETDGVVFLTLSRNGSLPAAARGGLGLGAARGAHRRRPRWVRGAAADRTGSPAARPPCRSRARRCARAAAPRWSRPTCCRPCGCPSR